jgi:GNAT superfamily N-acetyltransferase
VTDIVIREARAPDARGIAESHVRAWQDAYRGKMPDEYLDSLSPDQWEPGWKTILAQENQRTWVAARGEGIVGFVTAGPSRDHDGVKCGEVFAINLIADAWGTGAGARLLATAVAYLKAEGFEEATLWVLDTNARARRFYEREGWQLDGATKTDEERGFTLNEVRYRLALKDG